MRGINFLDMQKDILGVVGKYMKVDLNDVTVGGTCCFLQRFLTSSKFGALIILSKLWKYKSLLEVSRFLGLLCMHDHVEAVKCVSYIVNFVHALQIQNGLYGISKLGDVRDFFRSVRCGSAILLTTRLALFAVLLELSGHGTVDVAADRVGVGEDEREQQDGERDGAQQHT